MYHEATFVNRHKARAKSTMHSTAEQAATFAKKAKAKKLILGHFSNRYLDTDTHQKEAGAVFGKCDYWGGWKCNLKLIRFF